MRADAHYPADDVLISWATDCSCVELAAKCGVNKSSLRDYLRIRPELKDEIESVKKSKYVPVEIQLEKRRLSTSRWKESNRERVRATNRKWGRNQSPENRRKWNTYNMNRRRASGTELVQEDLWWLEILRTDPCPYGCADARGSIDHIQAIKNGGKDAIENLSGICTHHNASKGSKNLLQFMLWRNRNE